MSNNSTPGKSAIEAIVAGHICLDIIPGLQHSAADFAAALKPGALLRTGPALLATGGAVSNTGLALHRLGVRTRLLSKLGDDPLGRITRDLLAGVSPALAERMIIAPGGHSSYSIVLNPTGGDRTFLHCPGTNDTFGPEDLDPAALAGARIFHFGYPTVMHRLYSDGGVGLAEIFDRARAAGLTTSLDMTQVDPRSEAGRVDWPALLRRVLPKVDVFLPSFDETQWMLREHLPASEGITAGKLSAIGAMLREMGPAIVGLKLGDQGLYLRTSDDAKRLSPDWPSRELLAPCFQVNVAGATGAGDCTIAGFLAGLLRRLDPEAVMNAAVATGACCVERPDATSGVQPWDVMQARIARGWDRLPVTIDLPGWRLDSRSGIYQKN